MPVDELALVFDDVYRVVPKMRADGVPFTDEAVEALDHLDGRRAAMRGRRNAELWTEAALSDNPRWSELRHAARRTLHHLP